MLGATGGYGMSEASKDLARRWYEEVWNKQNVDAIDEMFPPDGKSHGFPNPDSVLVGPGDFKPIHANFCGAFPDLHVTIEDILAEGDEVALRWTANMTHLGDHLGIPATTQRVSLEGSTFMIAKDGKIIEGWTYMDLKGLIDQLQKSFD
jgi:steroid delta-isomerase-like uncharacterized protein